MWACWNTFIDGRFLGSSLKILATEAIILMYFTYYIETSGSTLKKKFCLFEMLTMALSEMQWERSLSLCKKKKVLECMQILISQQADQHWHQNWLGEGSTLSMIFWAGVSNVTQEPLAFATPCSAAILLP